MALLEAVDISKRFGGIAALSHVSLTVEPSERVGLIGPNGAGKTTLFNCIFGLDRPDTGRVVFAGHVVDRMPVHRRARLGMGRTFQRMELFSEMTVREHLLAAQRAHHGKAALWRDLLNRGAPTEAERGTVANLLDLLGIADIADRPAESLTLGHGRLVELGRALALDPRLLLLDEPSSGLDRTETAALGRMLLRIAAERDVGMLLVEHDLDLVRQVATRLYVLDFGQLVVGGPTEEVLEHPAVRRAYLGQAT